MQRSTYIFVKPHTILVICLLFAIIYLYACNNAAEQNNTRPAADYIKPISGISDSIPAAIAKKGEVLISYSDCNICHKVDKKSVGPSFKDIAKRYPVTKAYISLLAQKVITGGSRSWGYPTMDPHPQLSMDDAKTMVTYILSLRE